MTTNKPEAVAWIWDYRGRHMVTTDYSQALELAEPPYPTGVEPLIRLSDYEALQAECEKLRSGLDAVQSLIDNSEGVAGLHQNGDLATWGELLGSWLQEFDAAMQGDQP